MNDKLKNFINENLDLINENSKESWEEIYSKKIGFAIKGEFTRMILDSGINDPAEIMGYIPRSYLRESSISNYKIPNNVTLISDVAFSNCKSMTSITIPNSVTSIGEHAFQHCFSLTNVVIPDSVTHIGNNAFYGCVSLKNVIIPDSITSVGFSVFSLCYGLKSVVIGNNVTSIDNYAFSNCDSLMRVVIGSGVTSIGGLVFTGCKNLKEIQYKGTTKQAITNLKVKNKKWREGSAIEKIICTDGVIEL